MASAYVVINTEIGGEEETLEQLRKIPEVKEAHEVYGVYDLIVKIEAPTLEALKDTVTNKIRKIDKVRSTLTMIVTEEK
ncbi:Lrp/AsnC ligand binding domain-containing protein [Tardisphaera miroshnichenkoae]|nr:Lrp/AsnC ligand binding domain-containing protein [TACK group archaeon]